MKKGFTLIEMVIVIIILGVLASIVVPESSSYITNARAVEAQVSQKNFAKTLYLHQLSWEAGNLQNDQVSILNPTDQETYTLTFSGSPYLISLISRDTAAHHQESAISAYYCDYLFQALTGISKYRMEPNSDSEWAVTLNGNQCSYTSRNLNKGFTYDTVSGEVTELVDVTP